MCWKKLRNSDVKYTDDIVKKMRNIVTIYKKIENVSYGIDFMKIWCKILYNGIFNKMVGWKKYVMKLTINFLKEFVLFPKMQ